MALVQFQQKLTKASAMSFTHITTDNILEYFTAITTFLIDYHKYGGYPFKERSVRIDVIFMTLI